MQSDELIAAAQYLRMSTEQQEYSIENQKAAIQAYAARGGFRIVKTYSDTARSGVMFKNRPALSSLLQDVISGRSTFAAILVYDVSRWGRFQNCDEAAHYEFVCCNAGIPVHYCAEPFPNNDSLCSSVLKAIKRAMAAEYSRELGAKVFAAAKRSAELGFKQGGSPGFGLRRLMISSDGEHKQLLEKGDVKCLQSDRVVLVPGSPEEVACVREIFRLVVEEGRTPHSISKELNRRSLVAGRKRWHHQLVYSILTNPKYAGYNVWNQSSRRLGGRRVRIPKSQWVVKPGAFEPIVELTMFIDAQRALASRTCAKSDDQIIEFLHGILVGKGKLTRAILTRTPGAPSPATCKKRFGDLHRAFELAGYARQVHA